MKHLLALLFLVPFFLYSQSKQFYYEGNIGLSRTAIETGIDTEYMTMTYDKRMRTNASLLIGCEFPMGDYSLIDLEMGLCWPYVITGKAGLGNYYGKNDQFALILGIRPYPLSGYVQFNAGKKEDAHLIVSTELGSGGQRFMGTTSLFNLGLRIPFK